MPDLPRLSSFRRSAIAVTLLALTTALFLPAACRREDPISATLHELTSAVEERNSDAVEKRLSADFQGGDNGSRADVVTELRRLLFAYQNLDVELSDLHVARGEDRAETDFVATVRGNPKTFGGLDAILPRSTRLQMHLELQREGREWRVSGATWHKLE